MKSIIAAVIFLVAVGIIFALAFLKNIESDTQNVIREEVSATSTVGVPAPDTETQQPPQENKWVPPEFNGPTGPPRIIGPKSDPPNY